MRLIGTALLFFGTAAGAAPPVVKVEAGRVSGIALPGGQVDSYRGVPFAAPPIGSLRWREPQPAARWSGVRAADQFGARCMQQPLYSDMAFRSPGVSEDCLTLNVWTPAAHAKGKKLPVLLFLYGGGLMAGDASEKRYDGAYLASQGIVVVTANYRLGALGFLAHPELTAELPHHASGNYGMLDQAAALAWLKRNVAAFGGDPNRITIGGESAGSMSVSALMASPLTRGQIAGAIGESGGLMGPVAPMPHAAAEAQGSAFAASVGAMTLAQLRALPADTLLQAQGAAKTMHFGATIDGYLLTEPPAVTFAAGRAARVPLLAGTNSQESAADALLQDTAPTVANYRAALNWAYDERGERMFALYPAASDADVLQAATDLASDRFLGLATWKWFDLHRQAGAPAFYYQYRRVRPRALADKADWKAPLGAVHSAEIEYALGDLDVNSAYDWSEEDRRVSAIMRGYWANFIKSGDPNGPGLPQWPRAESGTASFHRQIIDVDTHSAPFIEQARYIGLEPLLDPR